MQVNEELADASSVLFYVKRNKRNLALLVDDISMKAIDDTDTIYGTNDTPQDTANDPITANGSLSAARSDRMSALLVLGVAGFMLMCT